MDKTTKFTFEEGKDYYLDNGSVVLTKSYLIKRGKCCSLKCRYCPFEPPNLKDNTNIKEKKDTDTNY